MVYIVGLCVLDEEVLLVKGITSFPARSSVWRPLQDSNLRPTA